MKDVGAPRIVESSLRDKGLNASTIDPKTRLMLVNTPGSRTSEKACTKIRVYRVSIPARPSCIVPLFLERISWRRSFGSWWSDSINLTIVEAKMNNPDDFVVRMAISLSLGHGLGRSTSLLRWAMVVNLCVRKSWMSLSTWIDFTSWSKKIWVRGSRSGRRNPVRIRGSGLPVMKNFTKGNSLTNRPKTERIAEAG